MNRERDEPERVREWDRERVRTRELPRYSVRDLDAIRDIGDYRVIRPRDLAVMRYDGDRRAVDQLATSGYVRRYTLIDPRIRTNEPVEILAVTRRGKSLLQRMDSTRRVYMIERRGAETGLQRPRDMVHDADVYPAVATVRERLEREGNRIERVILGAELAAERSRMVAEGKRRGEAVTIKRQREIASALELEVVHGRVMIPDARIEYRDPDGRVRHENVEVTTPNYSSGDRAVKSKAGFHLVAGVSFTHGRAPVRERS